MLRLETYRSCSNRHGFMIHQLRFNYIHDVTTSGVIKGSICGTLFWGEGGGYQAPVVKKKK